MAFSFPLQCNLEKQLFLGIYRYATGVIFLFCTINKYCEASNLKIYITDVAWPEAL